MNWVTVTALLLTLPLFFGSLAGMFDPFYALLALISVLYMAALLAGLLDD